MFPNYIIKTKDNKVSAHTAVSNPIFLLSLIITIFSALSCEDVITVKLKDASPKLVIVGNINNQSDSVVVTLSKTTDYFNPTLNSNVSGAQISISDNANNTYGLEEIKPGYYATANITAVPGTSFTLNVTSEEIAYTASSKMPLTVAIDSLAIDKPTGRQKQGNILCYAKDPAGIENYYRIRVSVNDSMLNPSNHFLLYSDKYFDGKSTIFSIGAGRLGIDKLYQHDKVMVQLISIDKQTYEYYRTLRDITDQGQILSVSTPANPPNNINNGALGYFSAWSSSEKTLIVK